ncbi:ATP-binding protein [Aeromonas bivalvium]|uniref:ATP-binding protein n=2 Tax=Aeromonas bivalvium TaxID=440079 RepID=UPI000DCFE038|nr:ATP-binding protein [Aeromonas bivalvium]
MQNDYPLQLISFEICNLYGLYTHEVKFDSSNIIILHGRNGVGKTALLKAIVCTFNGDFPSLIKIPFHKINALLNDGSSLTITKSEISGGVNLRAFFDSKSKTSYKLEIELIKNNKKIVSYTYDDIKNKSYNLIENNPWIVQVDNGKYFDRRTGAQFNADIFDDENFEINSSAKKIKSKGILLSHIRRAKVHLVETNRLFSHAMKNSLMKNDENEQITLSVNKCAKQLTLQISKSLKNYGETSQALDQSFPHRFINAPTPSMSLNDLKNRLQLLSQKICILQEQGILDSRSLQPFDTESLDNVEHNKLEIMNLYVNDSEEKLKTFDELSNKVKLLLESLNKKFSHKRIALSKDKGLIVYGQDDIEIELDDLSSGE